MKWEYKTLTYRSAGSFGTTSTETEVAAQMTLLEQGGWELEDGCEHNATLQPTSGGTSVLIFKRPKIE
jgi:hypothetical protein